MVIERFSFECRKTETKLLLRPIAANVNHAINQSECKANASNPVKLLENACDVSRLVLVWFLIG